MTPMPDPFRAAFQGRDPAPAAAVLRRMALAALADALGSGPKPAPLPPAPLANWFGEKAVQGVAVRRSMRLLQAAFLFGQIGDASPVGRAIVAGAVPAGRIAHLRDGLARRWRGKEDAVAPPGVDGFGPALAALAFSDPGFRRDVVAMVRDHLRARVLFHPDAAPVPVLSPACCMVLIGARTGTADRTPVTLGLHALAAALAAAAGWAAFWDQWVLHAAAAQPLFLLPRAIVSLPLLAHGHAAIALPGEETDVRVDPAWRNAVPGYCQQLLHGLP